MCVYGTTCDTMLIGLLCCLLFHISSSQLSSLFQAFSQVQHSSSEFAGTGLGLVISKRLVEAMGGSINVDSFPGRGSAFSFSIALQPADETKIEATESDNTNMNGDATTHPSRASSVASMSSDHNSQLYGLTPCDIHQLSRAHLIYIGVTHPGADSWARLCRHYGAVVHMVSTPLDGIEILQKSTSSCESIHGVVIDLDMLGYSEAKCLSLFKQVSSDLKFLFLNSKSPAIHRGTNSPISDSLVDDDRLFSSSFMPPPTTPMMSSFHVRNPSSSSSGSSPGSGSSGSASEASEKIHGVRHLRKPFAARTFLRSLLSLLHPQSTPAVVRTLALYHDPSNMSITVDECNESQSSLSDRPRRAPQSLLSQLEIALAPSEDSAPSPSSSSPPINQHANNSLHIPCSSAASSSATSSQKSSRRPNQPATIAPKIANIANQYPLRILLAEGTLRALPTSTE